MDNPLERLKKLKWKGKPISNYRIAKETGVSTNTVRAWDRGYFKKPSKANQAKLDALESRLVLEEEFSA